MSIIGQVERKSCGVKILNVSIHLILILGAVTMIYPFLLMLSGSIKSKIDFAKFNIIPEYLYNDEALFRKHIYTKYNTSSLVPFMQFKAPNETFDTLKKPGRHSEQAVKDYREFLSKIRTELPHYWRNIGMAYEAGVMPYSQRDYRAFMQEKFGSGKKGLEKLNSFYGTDFVSWLALTPPTTVYPTVKGTSLDYSSGILNAVVEYKNSPRMEEFNTYWSEPDLIETLRRDWGRSLKSLNDATDAGFNSWSDVFMTECVPANTKLAKSWLSYVREDLNPAFISMDQSALPQWRDFLRKKYGKIQDLNAIHGSSWTSFEDVKLPQNAPEKGQLATDWGDFLLVAPPASIHVKTLTAKYQDFLRKKYGSVDALNQAHDISYKSFAELKLKDAPPGESNIAESKLWHEFIGTLDKQKLSLTRNASTRYKTHVESFYRNNGEKAEKTTDFPQLSSDYKRKIETAVDIPFFSRYPEDAAKNAPKTGDHFLKAVDSGKFTDYYSLSNPELYQKQWEDFLTKKFNGDLAAMNSFLGNVISVF